MVVFYNLTIIQDNIAIVVDNHLKSMNDNYNCGIYPFNIGLNRDIYFIIDEINNLV